MFFDPDVDPTVTSKTPPPGKDILTASANNLYVGVTMKDLEGFDEAHPLNSRLVKQRRQARRRGLPRRRPLRRADRRDRRSTSRRRFRSRPSRWRKALRALITFYQTGETRDREAYDIAWVQDKASPVDTINGFIEVYLDARGIKGAWEALVFYVNQEKTSRDPEASPSNAQWFEDRMPWDPKYRKPGVQGITANAIDVVIETGDSGPITPVGINLPNDQAIREQLRQQVGVAVERQRGLRQVDAAGVPQRVLVDAGGGRARDEVERVRRRADDQHARGDRPRVGQGRRAAEGQPAGGAEGAVLGARGGARRSRRAVFPARSEAGRARPRAGRPITTRSSAPSTRPTRATRSCSCAASARARRSKKTTCATAR